MTKNSRRKAALTSREISWKRVRAIFNDPEPPEHIWQHQFDGCDEKLRHLARTPPEEIDSSDLWYYYDDLAWVELQPELFAYLFPACLMDWHQSLMQNVPCGTVGSGFHFGVHYGKVFETMLTPEQQASAAEFFRDSLLVRLDAERHIIPQDHDETSAFAWLRRFNSLGIILPNIELIWDAWWSLDTPGRAIAAIQYLSGLMYYRPWLWENDSDIHHDGWIAENVDFLEATLTVEFVHREFANAVTRLSSEPQFEPAQGVQLDLADWSERIEDRIGELLSTLRDPYAKNQ